MVRLLHVAPDPEAGKIRRSGLSPRRLQGFAPPHDRYVWAFPVLESFTLTHQWARELKRFGAHTQVAVHFRMDDDEPVLVGHYSAQPQGMRAGEAVGLIRQASDPRGYEVMIPRRVLPSEITRIALLPRAFGWRYYPDAKNRPMKQCDCPVCMPRGEIKASRYRAAILRRRTTLGLRPGE